MNLRTLLAGMVLVVGNNCAADELDLSNNVVAQEEQQVQMKSDEQLRELAKEIVAMDDSYEAKIKLSELIDADRKVIRGHISEAFNSWMKKNYYVDALQERMTKLESNQFKARGVRVLGCLASAAGFFMLGIGLSSQDDVASALAWKAQGLVDNDVKRRDIVPLSTSVAELAQKVIGNNNKMRLVCCFSFLAWGCWLLGECMEFETGHFEVSARKITDKVGYVQSLLKWLE